MDDVPLPFTFSLLPASANKVSETLELVPALAPALPLPPSTPLADVERAASAWKVMEKEIRDSGVGDQRRRFLTRNEALAERIMPQMTGEEAAEAYRLNGGFPVKKRRCQYGEEEARERGRLLPLVFSLLPASQTKHGEALQLIPIPTPVLPIPPPPPAAEELKAANDSPDWIAKLAADKKAESAWKVMEKKIYSSDVSGQQNRFLITNQAVAERIMPRMTGEEKAAANLLGGTLPPKMRRVCQAGERKRGREHGGLEVMVYARDGRGFSLRLTRWDASKASVLKGASYRAFLRRSYFAAGDAVEMWAFRGEDGKLFFAVGKRTDLELSL